MKPMDLLDILDEVQEEFVVAAMPSPAPKRRPIHRGLLIAAIITLMVFLLGCAVVVLNLDKLILGQEIIDIPQGDDTSVTEPRTALSLQGFQGSPEFQASKEWFEFMQSYDPDGAILMSVGDDADLAETYSAYGCYTPEMAAKVDELCEKYGLTHLGPDWSEKNAQEQLSVLGIDQLVRGDAPAEVSLFPGYYFADGSFQLPGLLTLTGENAPWPHSIDFSLRYVKKGSFDGVYASIRQDEVFEQWVITTDGGQELLLVLGENRAFIFADLSDAFLSVSIYNATVDTWYLDGPQTMTAAALEAFAGCFDLSIQTQTIDPDEANARLQQRLAEEEARQQQLAEEDYIHYGVGSYAERVRYFIEEDYHPYRYGYTLLDLDGDGIQELLIGQDGYIKHIFTYKDGETVDLTGIYYSGSTFLYLCENNVIARVWDNALYRSGYPNAFPMWEFGRLVDGEIRWEECLIYDQSKDDNPWLRSGNSGEASTPISEQEFHGIISSYRRTVVELLPLDRFPGVEARRDPQKVFPQPLYGNSYDGRVISRLERPNEGDVYTWALIDLDGNGQQELIWDEGYITEIFTMQDDTLCKVISGYDLTLCRNNILKKVEYYSGNNYAISYYEIVDGAQLRLVDYLRYDADANPDSPWMRGTNGSAFDESLVSITETQWDCVIVSYPAADIDMKSIAEYPLS